MSSRHNSNFEALTSVAKGVRVQFNSHIAPLLCLCFGCCCHKFTVEFCDLAPEARQAALGNIETQSVRSRQVADVALHVPPKLLDFDSMQHHVEPLGCFHHFAPLAGFNQFDRWLCHGIPCSRSEEHTSELQSRQY